MTTGHATRRKLATAIRGYLDSLVSSALADYTFTRGILSGSRPAKNVEVNVTSCAPDFDDDESRVWKIATDLVVRTRVDFASVGDAGVTQATHDAAAEAIEAGMHSDLVRAFVNSENIALAGASSGGTYVLNDTADETSTTSLAHNANAAAIQAALRGGPMNFAVATVSGGAGVFTIDRGVTGDVTDLTATPTGLLPSTAEVRLIVLTPGTGSLNATWKLLVGTPSRPAADFFLHAFRQPEIMCGYDREEKCHLSVLRFDFRAMADDGDAEPV